MFFLHDTVYNGLMLRYIWREITIYGTTGNKTGYIAFVRRRPLSMLSSVPSQTVWREENDKADSDQKNGPSF